MADQFFIHHFPNGLVLLADRLEHVVSTAVQFALPAGCRYDGDAQAGAGTVLAEWLMRGAGERDTRQLNDALDALGCHHDENIFSSFLQLTAAQTHQNLRAVLEIYADILRRPRLEEEMFEPCRNLALQDLTSLEDEPSRKANIRVREQFYPVPLGASSMGRVETLSALTDAALREHAGRHMVPRGTILAVAGHFEWDELRVMVEEQFASWQGASAADPIVRPAPNGITHETKPTAQAQIALAYAAPLPGEEHYYPMRVAEMILGGGMSGRLFTEVREKRGLVYHVSARYQTMKEAAGIFVYAGTAPQRAQQTLDVTVGELRRLAEGVTSAELARAKTQLKSTLIMQGESTSSRAHNLTSDWHLLGRLRSLEEISAAVDAVTEQHVLECLAAFPAENFTAYFIGPDELDASCLKP